MGPLNRRQMIHGVAGALGVTAAARSAGATPAAPPGAAAAEAPSREEAPGLRDALGAGVSLGAWRIVAVHPVTLGAVPVVLEGADGRRFQVDLLARDPHPGAARAVAETERYALYLANLGHGATATRQDQGLGAMALAEHLRACEAQHPPLGLMTLRARAASFPTGVFSVLE